MAPTLPTDSTAQSSTQAPAAGTTEGLAALPTDVTMASVTQQMEALQATFDLLMSQQGTPLTDANRLPEISRPNGTERLRSHMMKPKNFANLPGENFLAWRAQFQVIATYNRWSQDEAKAMAFAHMIPPSKVFWISTSKIR